MREAVVVGVDVGGSKILAGAVSGQGAVLHRVRLVTPGGVGAPSLVEEALVEAVGSLQAAYEVTAIGIGAAGWVDRDGEVVRFAPHLPWREEPLAARLQDRLGVPVWLDNDANTGALAELRLGAARHRAEMLFLTLGSGIGGAQVSGGRVVRGAHGLAGEFGHMPVVPAGRDCPCGGRGCWEQYASGDALVREARELVARGSPDAVVMREFVGDDSDRLTGEVVTAAAERGDPAAMEAVRRVGEWLGVGIGGLCAGLDPELVVVGGGVSQAGDLLLGPARAALSQTLPGRGFRPVPPIVAAALGADASMVGAALMAGARGSAGSASEQPRSPAQ